MWFIIISFLLINNNKVEACSSNPQCTFADRYILHNFNRAVSFAEAEAHCISQNTNLASVHSLADWSEAKSKCLQLANQGCWIGLNDIETEGNYVYTDGTTANYFNWGTGEPTGAAEDCVSLYPPKEYKFNDFTCTGKQGNIMVQGVLCNNPEYDPDQACLCECDVCRIEGDPHVTTFDKLQYHFMGPCSYYYVTPCIPNNYVALPFEIVGEHQECFSEISGRTCLKNLWVNLYDEDTLVVQILMEEGLKATFTSKTTLSGFLPGTNVPVGQAIVWDNDPKKSLFYNIIVVI